MNKKMLKRFEGKLFEIDPPARSLSPYGEFLGVPLRKWALVHEQGKFRIQDIGSNHFVFLNSDNFKGFREPNILQLKAQLTRQGNHCWQDPPGFNRRTPLPGYPNRQAKQTEPFAFTQGVFWGALGMLALMTMAKR